MLCRSATMSYIRNRYQTCSILSMTLRTIIHTLLVCLMLTCCIAAAQAQIARISILDSGQSCSIRGMSIPSDGVVLVSSSNGHVSQSTDAGKYWHWMVVAGYEKVDFRDIHAFDSSAAVIMGIGEAGYMLMTRAGGKTWKPVYSKDMGGMVLDA